MELRANDRVQHRNVQEKTRQVLDWETQEQERDKDRPEREIRYDDAQGPYEKPCDGDHEQCRPRDRAVLDERRVDREEKHRHVDGKRQRVPYVATDG